VTIVEFLNARLADPVGQGDPDLDCDGVGEYYRCDEWSEWHRRTVEAQRAIIGWHSDNPHECEGPMGCEYVSDDDSRPCSTMLALASVYSDHPDYREEWKP